MFVTKDGVATGVAGAQGPAGAPGAAGAAGAAGVDGVDGTNGTNGIGLVSGSAQTVDAVYGTMVTHDCSVAGVYQFYAWTSGCNGATSYGRISALTVVSVAGVVTAITGGDFTEYVTHNALVGGSPAFTMEISGSDVLLRSIGIAGQTINWKVLAVVTFAPA